ncbi:MAG: DUF305 domain-containing protein [Gemmatimonadota bacterium]|nr:DUF305 domain-containing protein [Gemmatimonadota bacterium]MDH4349887.1 DUF305 domain-containing protein [Gemmatimonadota bacterium]MDH5198069.1 DUF305 domain-containing protein [Gemmatimonadota bacterium]
MRPARHRPYRAALPIAFFAAAGASALGPTNATAQDPNPDVRFVQGMIHHHAQALVMTDLLTSRSQTEAMHLLAERITVSQRDEIGLMRRWLTARQADVPQPPVTLDQTAGHHGHGMMMPGMLSDAQLQQLAAASGAEFDRLFLTFMIRHHEGALTMVTDLFATPNAGQDSWIYQFASDVDADQRAEIARMRQMLTATTEPPHRR